MNIVLTIELLTVLQLVAIRNSSDSNNIKLSTATRLFKKNWFLMLNFRKFSLTGHKFCLRPSSALKIMRCGPWPKKLFTSVLV